jgi:aminocarboxymuconate-semialdehyde decarboxylase
MPAKPIVIDFHAHIATEAVFAATYKLSVIGQLRAKTEGGGIHPMPEGQMARMTDLATRLADMDAMGVDIQVISPSILHQCTYSLDPQEALRLERIGNEHVAETVAKKPDRLIGLGSVPLQDAALAAAEMERAVRDLGLKGIVIASRVNETELGDAALRPFWRAAEALDVPIFIHPAGNPDARLRRHSLLISLGQPLEEAFAQCSLIYDGVMDQFPRLKIAFAHGGGFIPYYAGRFDWMVRRGTTKGLEGDFSSYLRLFHYESVVFNADVLERLAEKVEASHIMLGTDYPFGEWKPVEFVQSAAKIPEALRLGILGANAARFLGVDV